MHMSSGTQQTAIVPAGQTTALAVASEADAFMPVMSIEQAVGRRNLVVQFAQKVMVKGLDYGAIPGTGEKPTLLKPGAEKLCSLFGLVPDFQDYRVTEDWENGFFFYAYRCVVSRNGKPIGSGIGSCNSREKKYRRDSRACPECGKPAIKRSKYPPRDDPQAEPGWYCFGKAGGCGANFAADDPAIVDQSAKVDPNEVADLVNTIQKMAQKRALVAAVLVATSASEFFTQDVEDMGIIDAEVEPPRGRTPAAHAPVDDEPQQTRQEWFLEQWDALARERGLNGAGRGVLPVLAKKEKLPTDINAWTDQQCDAVLNRLRNATDEQIAALKKPAAKAPAKASAAQVERIGELLGDVADPGAALADVLRAHKVEKLDDLTADAAVKLIQSLEAEPAAAGA